MPASRLDQQLDKWRQDLVNLTRRNRLLYFGHLRTATLEVLAPGPAELAAGLSDALRRRWSLGLPPGTDLAAIGAASGAQPDHRIVMDKPDEPALLRSLKALERKTEQEYLDKGLWILYLTLGMLQWVDDDGKPAQSPLLLVPVRVRRPTPRDVDYLERTEDDVVANPALTLKLAEYGIELPPFDPAGDLDPASVIIDVGRRVADRAGWKVKGRSVIATFTFHKEAMYRDLLDNQDRLAGHPIVRALAGECDPDVDLEVDPVPEDELDTRVLPEHLVNILPSDASQRQCIAAARDGATFAMDGPPGTGKSQTIANIIAEVLHAGRTVLFVSEKAAALEVVEERLNKAGLGAFLLELHSHKATRKEVAQTLGHALHHQPATPRGLAEADRQRAMLRRQQLNDYARAANEVRQPLGRSLHTVIGQVAHLEGAGIARGPSVSSVDASLSAERLATCLDAAARLGRAWGPVQRGEDFVWRGVAAQRDPSLLLRSALADLDALERINGVATEELRLAPAITGGDVALLVAILDHLSRQPAIPPAWLVGDLQELRAFIADTIRRDQTLTEAVRSAGAAAGPRWRQLDGTMAARLSRALDATAAAADWQLPASATEADIGACLNLVGSSTKVVADATAASAAVAQSYGVEVGQLTASRATTLGQLARLSAAPVKPYGWWLNPDMVPHLRSAVASLQPLVGQHLQYQQSLRAVFTQQVLSLDIGGLIQRHANEHGGFGRLGGPYRADKRQLASATPDGRVRAETWSRLPEARNWQQCHAALLGAEQHFASLLGDYYRREATDFGAVTSAVNVAATAVSLLGGRFDQAAAASRLGIGATPDADLLAYGQLLAGELVSWGQGITAGFDRSAPWWGERSLADVAAWLDALAAPLAAVRDVLSRVRAVLGHEATVAESEEALALAVRAHDAAAGFDARRSTVAERLGPLYQGLSTQWREVHDAVAWVERARHMLGRPADEARAVQLLAPKLPVQALRDALATWEKSTRAVVDLFEVERQPSIEMDLGSSFADARDLVEELLLTAGDIQEWFAYAAAARELAEAGLEPVLSHCVRERVAASAVADVVERTVLECWLDDVMATDPRLRDRRASDRDALVAEFAAVDKLLVDLAAAQVISACNARRPRTLAGVAGIIDREANKKSRHMPVRELLRQAQPVVRALKPCFMMSPLSVSQYLSPDMRFDLVVFDEASQVRPADGLNCIYRADGMIVAGDQKQLPPTSFFEAVSDEDDVYEEDQLEEFESLLDLAKGSGGLSSLSLNWHYRSRHESLITFSNYSFYDGRLITFPGALHSAPDVGVELFPVAGVYRRGGRRDNPVEAERVVERVLYHARAHPELPIGVVAFSEAQASAIQDALDRARQHEARDLDDYFTDDRLSGFFVKNLESVQGDERDIMIFSVGYGPDEAGRFTMNFGPVNRSGGEKRLNVAITRARQRVEVVTSVTAGDFTASVRAEGVRHLQRYLDYAARGPAALAVPLQDSQGDAESPFEEEVLRVLRSWGYDAVPQVGTAGYRIDIGVRHPEHPGRFALGVECDGARYHSSKVARDRDRLRGEVLTGLGWRLHRIWGSAWYGNRAQEEARLRSVLLNAIADPGGGRLGPDPARPERRSEDEFEPVDLTAAPSWTQPYLPTRPRAQTRWMDIFDPAARPEVQRLVVEVVSGEGPVHPDIVLARVRDAWGLRRGGSRVRDAVETAVAATVRSGTVERQPDGMLARRDAALVGVRTPDDADPATRRKIDEIPAVELDLAVRLLVVDAHSIDEESLTTAVTRLFGWGRRGADIQRRLDDTIETLVSAGALARADGCLITPSAH